MSQKSLLQGISWSFAEKLLPQLVSLIVSIILARLLGPTEYRAVAVVLIFINICDVLVATGFGMALIQKNDADKLDYSTISIFSVSLSIVVAIGLSAFSPTIEDFFEIPYLAYYLAAMSIRIPLAVLNSIQRAYLQKRMQFNRIFVATLAGTLLSGIIGIVMAQMGFGTWALIAQYLSNSIISTVIFLFIARYPFGFQFSWHRFVPMFRFSWKLILSALFSKLYDECRAVIIDKKYSDNSISYYNKGIQIPNVVLSTVNASITTVMFPVMSEIQGETEKLKDALKNSIKLSAYVIMPMMLGLMIVSEPLVTLLYTEEWIAVVSYMQIFAVSYMCTPIIELNQRAVQAIGKSGVVMNVEIVNKIFGLLTMLLAILYCNSPVYIAGSFGVYMLFSLILSMLVYGRIIGYSILRQLNDIKSSLFISLLMCCMILPLRYIINNMALLLISQIVLGVCMYILLSSIFKIKEFQMLRETLIKIIKNNRKETDLPKDGGKKGE